ncbi:hypothetical protein [Aliidiomarina sanyensis]|uniref:Calx-beta domain-containing protein n=1 Tax=Aliidiomarina sanyensis TaxID=1249555 RepID=A0A432WHY3_9GAMM|nr:hypothetical protein [Aliidiomarina sanyensis]RUO33432.1 hypothetical protein CWE11_06195 [Aliidiomarina sanyensis]
MTVNRVGTSFDEEVEFAVQLSRPVNLQLPSTRQFNVSILPAREDEIVLPQLQLPSVIAVPEPSEERGEVEYEFWFPLSQPAPVDGSVIVRTFDGSAIRDVNFEQIESERIGFAAGDDHIRVPLTILYEGRLLTPKELQIQFASAEEIILPANRSVTISIDPDAIGLPEVQIENEYELVRPPLGEETTITVVLPFTTAAIMPGRIDLVVNQGGALIPRDFNNVPLTVEFDRGDREAVFEFTLNGVDTDAERTFSIVLSSATNALLPQSASERTIVFTIVSED